MSKIDVRDLAKEQLPTGKFPADSRADFRLHMSPDVRHGIEQHAKADTSVEICGVLVGQWGQDENGPYVNVTNYIRCENAASKMAEVTFTHESWAQINKQMDSKFTNDRIVGWYHSHPDFGIFLSERDCFIHEHFFSGAGQVAYVIDPVRDLEGVFAWRAGKPSPLSHYWIGNQLRTVDASERNVGRDMAATSQPLELNASHVAERRPRDGSLFGMLATILGALGVFALGYLYGDWRSDWEQQLMFQGAVAQFADTNLIRPGLETNLAAVNARLAAIRAEVDKLPDPSAKLSKEELSAAEKRRKFITENLLMCESAIKKIEEVYGLSEAERTILAKIAAMKQAEIRRFWDSPSARQTDAKPVSESAIKEKESSSARDNAPSSKANDSSDAPAVGLTSPETAPPN
jgi:proteasome lid subunit RPN8/RPN11